jgi:hypothetical protein
VAVLAQVSSLSAAPTQGTGWSLAGNALEGTSMGMCVEYQSASSTGNFTGTFVSGSTTQWVTLIGTFAAPGLPVNTVAPVVSGVTIPGATLSCSEGTWTGAPTSFAYQWTSNGTNIVGATASTYRTQSADMRNAIGCTVTATNAFGSVPQASNTISVAGMLVTNLTSVGYWFGPRYLPGSGTLVLDDTSDTSLYLTDDAFADRLNTLVQSGEIGVTGAASPFPRPTGSPAFVHADGSPQGRVYAPQGSIYLRRDARRGSAAVLAKTTGVTFNVGWANIVDPWTAYDQALGLQASTFPLLMANNAVAPSQERALACGVWLNAGTVLTGLLVNYVSTNASLTHAFLGVYNASYELEAMTGDVHGSFGSTSGWIEALLSPAPYSVPTTGLYYFALLFVGSTTPAITVLSGAGAQASQPNPSGQYPCFAGSGSSDTTLVSPASPVTTSQVPWIAGY